MGSLDEFREVLKQNADKSPALAWLTSRLFDGQTTPSETQQSIAAILPKLEQVADEAIRNRFNAESQLRRQNFSRTILGIEPGEPEKDLERVCTVWAEACAADSAWLLLRNAAETQKSSHVPEHNEPWEWASQYPTTLSPPHRLTANDECIAELCRAKQRIIFAKTPANWTEEWRGKHYNIPWQEAQTGFHELICIPILQPILRARDNSLVDPCPLTDGAIILLYRNINLDIPHPEQSLLVMGQLTAFAIFHSYQAEQRKILVSMNRLAEEFLTKGSRMPWKLRRDYLAGVAKLIVASLHVQAVSIFYRDISSENVCCIFSTGLASADGIKVAEADWSNACYKVGEHLTGKCYAERRIIVLTNDRKEHHRPKFLEMPHEQPVRAMPAIFCPIPSHPQDSRALGVIRCAMHTSRHSQNGMTRFSPMEMQTLGFIASQLGPVLHTMDFHIRREQTISLIKHDLKAPIGMIEDTLLELEAEAPQNSQQTTRIKNIRTSVAIASQLLGQLEPDAELVRSFNPVPTFLEGDIIARLKAMMSHYAWKARRIKITFASLKDVVQVRVDRDLIERAIVNLLVNAIKYGDPDTEVSIVSGRHPEGFALHVINYGPGIEDEDIPHIFKPNFRARSTAHLAMGSGLGLTIAKAAMEAHGGRLELAKPKSPTVFSLIFPRQLFITT